MGTLTCDSDRNEPLLIRYDSTYAANVMMGVWRPAANKSSPDTSTSCGAGHLASYKVSYGAHTFERILGTIGTRQPTH